MSDVAATLTMEVSGNLELRGMDIVAMVPCKRKSLTDGCFFAEISTPLAAMVRTFMIGRVSSLANLTANIRASGALSFVSSSETTPSAVALLAGSNSVRALLGCGSDGQR